MEPCFERLSKLSMKCRVAAYVDIGALPNEVVRYAKVNTRLRTQ